MTGSPGVVLLVPSATSSQCSYRGTGESWTIQDMVLLLSAGAFMGGGGGGKESNSKEQCIKWNSEHFLTTKLTQSLGKHQYLWLQLELNSCFYDLGFGD